jgi:hypothetical protein
MSLYKYFLEVSDKKITKDYITQVNYQPTSHATRFVKTKFDSFDDLRFDFLVHILTLIAFLTITLSNALPYTFENTFDNDPSTVLVKSNIVRREEYDPYGFNSILSRFHKRFNDKQNKNLPNQPYFA